MLIADPYRNVSNAIVNTLPHEHDVVQLAFRCDAGCFCLEEVFWSAAFFLLPCPTLALCRNASRRLEALGILVLFFLGSVRPSIFALISLERAVS